MARKRDIRTERREKRRPWTQQRPEPRHEDLEAAFQQLERERATVLARGLK